MNTILQIAADLIEPATYAAETLPSRLESGAAGAGSAARTATSSESLGQLHRRIDRLSLACQAMWELLRDKTGVTEAELTDKILEVDLRDGSTDGRMTSAAVDCPHCHAKTSPRRPTCLMCGVEIPRRQQFEV